MTKEEVLTAVIAGSQMAIETGSSEDGWVWTSEINLYPLGMYSAKLRSLEKQGMIEITGCQEEVRSGWGRMVRPVDTNR